MMWYILLATDADDVVQARLQAREAHLARLALLHEQGRLLSAGPTPMPDDENAVSGSLIIARFDDLDAAEAWAQDDPYVQAGVYAEILIRPYRQVLPHE